MDRRSMFSTTATLAVGAVAGCALPATAATGAKTPFQVPATQVIGWPQRPALAWLSPRMNGVTHLVTKAAAH